MRQMRVAQVLLTVGALATLATAQTSEPGWSFIYQKGEAPRFRTYIRITARNPDDTDDIKLTVRSTSKNTVVDITPEGSVVWEQLDEKAEATINGMTLPVPDDIKPVVVTFSSRGIVTKRVNPSADPADLTQKLVRVFGSLPVPPMGVKLGDTWETELPNPMLKNKQLKVRSTFVAKESVLGVECLKVQLTATFPYAYGLDESDYLQFNETYWLDAKTRQLIRASYTAKNALLPFPAKNVAAQALTSRIIEGQNETSDPDGEALLKAK